MSKSSGTGRTIDQDTLITDLFHQVEAIIPDDDLAVARGKKRLLAWMDRLPLEPEQAAVPPQPPALARPRASAEVGPKGRPLNEVVFLTVAEVAELMRVSKGTVYRLVHSGHLPAIRVGRSFRVPQQAVHEYLRESFVTEEIGER